MAGSAGRGGAGGTGGAGLGGRGGTNLPGDAGASGLSGRGGAGGSAGSAGSAGRGGTGGSVAGGGGRGGAAGAGTGGAGGKLTNPRIMPLGDSTTASICYRSHLAQMLNSAGKTYDFVGSRKGDPGCSFTSYDQDNEGHGGYIVTDILKAAGTGVRPGGADTSDPYVSDSRDLATWFDNRPADIVLMHFGTNDVWNNIAPATILNAYTTILTKLRAVNPSVRVLVAQITSLQPSGCNDCPTRVQTLNGMIPGWASQNSTAASPISVVDQNTGFNAPAGMDTADGVHANDAGSIKIATKWFNALSPLF
jgi:lysophospholipase L1-like esterase